MNKPKKIIAITNPEQNETKNVIESAIRKRQTLVILGNCRVLYDGRANSTLQYGERVLIIKGDGSILIHRPVGYEPVNWQPPGSIFYVQNNDGKLEILSNRQKHREFIKVIFSKIFLISATSLLDTGEFLLHATENDMHKAILAKPDIFEAGFKPISWEKKVEPGFVDLYGEDKNGKLVIVEVKRKAATKEAALQLSKYIEPIKSKINRDVRGVLVAPSLKKDVQRLLATLGLEFKCLTPKKCSEVLKRTENTKLEKFFK